MYKTFEQWKEKGRVVKKGQKACGRLSDGTCIFSKDQTKKAEVQRENYGDDVDYEADYEQWEIYEGL